jgi:hypothetical protein
MCRNDLIQGFRHLVERFPSAAKHCNVDRFLEVVSNFHDGWKPNAGEKYSSKVLMLAVCARTSCCHMETYRR